jgi:beta-galactosidase
MKLLSSWAIAYLAAQAAGAAISHSWNGYTITEHPDPVKRDLLQKHVCCFLDLGFGWLC